MIWRAFTLLSLVLTLVVSTQGAAFAAGQNPAKDQVVICTGFGTHVIFVDADGDATTPPQLCADAFKSFVALDAGSFLAPVPDRVVLLVLQSLTFRSLADADLPPQSARAPPVLI